MLVRRSRLEYWWRSLPLRITVKSRERADMDELNATMAGEILHAIGVLLDRLGCCHGHDQKGGTPPMFYEEWICCVVGKREKRIKELEAQVAAISAQLPPTPTPPEPRAKEDAT